MNFKKVNVNRRDFIKGSLVLTGGLLIPNYLVGCQGNNERKISDIVVYGGTSAGVIAAVQAVKLGKSVSLVSPDKQLGGLSTAGLGFTDTGNRSVICGLSKEFYHRIWKHYDSDDAWTWQSREDFDEARGQGGTAINDETETAWVFEPSVAEQIFEDFVEEYGIDLYRDEWLDRNRGIEVRNGVIQSISTISGKNYRGKMFIDATYEGDLMAAASVSYTVGREPNSKYGKTINGIQSGRQIPWGEYPYTNQMPWSVDSYNEPGNPESGIISWPPINPDPGCENGEGDHRVQAYCFRMCLTDVEKNLVPIEKPDPIDYGAIIPKKHECENLLVPVAVSASHIAFGSIRMEPAFMILGQSAATAACMAIDTNQATQDISYGNLKNQLINDAQIL